jgi:hypothetical protein
MSTYHYYKEGYQVPYDAAGNVLLRRKLDVPALIAESEKSSLAVSGDRTLLPSTGFAIADILQIWRVPAGIMLIGGGVRVSTAGSATSIDVGHASGTATMVETGESNRWLTTCLTAATGYFNFDCEDGDEWVAYDGNYGVRTLSIANLSIDVTFNTVAETTLIADFWMWGYKVY